MSTPELPTPKDAWIVKLDQALERTIESERDETRGEVLGALEQIRSATITINALLGTQGASEVIATYLNDQSKRNGVDFSARVEKDTPPSVQFPSI